MSKTDMQEKDFLSSTDLERELSGFVEKNVIPDYVAEKIAAKLNTTEIAITKDQLHELVDMIKEKIRKKNFSKPHDKNDTVKDDDFSTSSSEEVSANELMKTLNELNERIKRLEEAQGIEAYPGGSDTVGRIVTTEDISVPEDDISDRSVKVYPLEEIPDNPESVVVLMKWLQYLVDRVGKNNLLEVLNYYVDIGWLSDNMVMTLMEYAKGITNEKSDKTQSRKLSDLQSSDHIQSLLFLQRVQGKQPDSGLLNKIDRDLSKIRESP